MTELIQTFATDKISVFFNGGKDSIVLLHLLSKVFNLSQIPVVFILKEDEFPQVLKHINFVCSLYDIDIQIFSDMKGALEQLINKHKVSHVFTGIRLSDPYGPKTSLVQKTDSDWPQVVLVNPLLNWSSTDIWKYIFDNNLPYCELYDQGYTSLGETTNTFKNHLLFNFDSQTYIPAFSADDSVDERANRINFKLPLTLSGPVIHGDKRGKELGYPTANILIEEQIKLDQGIYYGTLCFDDELKYFVMSYGHNIHFDTQKKTLEIHILDLKTDDFYDKVLRFTIVGFIRKMGKFSNTKELIDSIGKDIIIARYNLLFLQK